ncbi:hypothetical protein ACOMHN_058035 [Nucella lapillus]
MAQARRKTYLARWRTGLICHKIAPATCPARIWKCRKSVTSALPGNPTVYTRSMTSVVAKKKKGVCAITAGCGTGSPVADGGVRHYCCLWHGEPSG